MKNIVRRGFSLLLVLAMTVSLFAGMTLSASAAQPTSANDVNYVTSGQYVYNWGKRDTTATFLTTYAQQYYTGDYTYAKLSALSGSSASGTGFYTSAMGTAIHNMLVAKQKSTTSYDALKTLFQYTECEESSKTQISSYYSGQSMGSTWGSGWNREHTWPDSKGLNGSDENDVMMIKPTLVSENSSRGNTAYGNSYYDPNSNGQQLHGDVARMMLQHLMRWGNTNYFYGASGVMESRAVLLEWMEEDPVDTWEMGRNDAIQQITGVRNVFVDYPELGFLLLGEDVPANYRTPSQSGGTVTPAQEYTVTFNVPNGVTRPASVTASRVTLPTPSGNPTGDYTYTFKGWVEASVDNETAKPASIHEAGEQLALSKDTTLYALYSYTVAVQGGGQERWQKIENLTTFGEGTYALLSPNLYAFSGISSGNGTHTTAKFSFDNNGYADSAPSGTVEFTATAASGGYRLSCSDGYLYATKASSGGLALSQTAKGIWTGEAAALQCKEGSITAHLRTYNDGFRPYSTATTNAALLLAKKTSGASGTIYYTTVIGTECNHTYTTVVTAPTCTAGGYTTYTCSKCGFSYTDNATTALGHAYGTATSNGNGTHTAACSRCGKTVTEDCTYTTSVSGATTTFTCSVCNYSYSTTLDTYTVTYSVPAGVPAITAAQVTEGSSVTLPTAGAVDGYAFAGWVKNAISSEITTAPTVLTGSYKPTANVTLYALYTRTETGTGTGTGSSDYVKVTKTSDLTDGQYLIVYEDGEVALDSSLATIDAVEDTIDVTISNNTIPSNNTTDAAAFTFTASNGSFLGTNGKYIGHTGSSNTLNTSTSAMSNTVSIDSDGNAVIDAGGSYVLRYNNTSGQYRFRFYKGTQQPIQLYKKSAGSSSTTYYTTNPVAAVPCAHNNMETITAIAATCEAAGNNAYYHCPDCGKYFKDAAGNTETAVAAETLAALGHTYGAFTSNDNGTHSKTCSRCSDKVTEDCSYTDTISGATVTHTCNVCHYSYQTTLGTYTVTLNTRGTTSTLSCVEGASVTLPTAAVVDGYSFAGWVTTAIDEQTTDLPTVIPAGSYAPSADITLYALYTCKEEGTGTGSSFDLVTNASDITDGSYVLIVEANNGSKFYAIKQQADDSYVAAAAADSYIGTAAPAQINVTDTSIIWALAGTSASFTLKNADASCWLYNSSNKLYYSKTNTAASFKATLRSDNETFTLSPASGRYMGLRSDLEVGTNGLYRFRCNSTASSSDYYFYIYKNAGGTGDVIYYTTAPVISCAHTDMQTISAKAATCTEGGNNAYFYCPDCGKFFTDADGSFETTAAAQTIEKLGHDLSDETTPATCTTAGETVTSCSRCDYSVSTPIAALGHNYDNGVITTAPTATAEGVMTYTCDRCGDFYTSVIPALGEKIPYTRATEITSGSNYIMAFHYTYNGADKWYGIGGVSSSACSMYEIPAPVGNIVALDKGTAYLWTIEAVSNTTNGYTLKNGNSYLKGTSSSTNLSTATTAVTWTAVDGKADDTFWFEIGDRGIGLQSGSTVKNYAVSNANNTGVDYLFDIYLFENVCAHTNTHMEGAKEASCTTNGYTGDKVCDDCGVIVEKGTTILQGHDYVEASRTEATCETAGNIHYECSRCDSVKDVAIAALGHNYEQSAHVDATCTADGYTTYVCSHDESHTYTDTIPAIGHHYDPETGICDNCHDQLASCTVSFTVPAGINAIDPITAFDGTKISLPEPTGTLLANAENYVFAGWVTTDVTDETDTDFIEAGEYTVTGNVSFKALYSWVGEESYGDDGVYKLLTEEDAASLDTDWMLIIANDGKWEHKTMALADYTSGGNEKFAGKTVTVTNNTITVPASSDVQQFTVVKDADSGYFYLISNYTDSEDTLYYLTSCTNTANANNITLTANPTAAALWSISYHEDGTVKLTAQGSWTANTVQFNSANYGGLFTCYGETFYGNAPTNIYGIRLFASNPIFHFTTEPAQNCEHENVTWTDNKDGTCSCTCDDCGHIVADHQTHAWTHDPDAEDTVAATCLAGGKAGYVCDNCGAAELRDTEKLGHDYVGVQTTAPTCSAAGVMTYTCSRCEDSYKEAIPAGNHNFEDGTCTMCGASLYVLVTEAPENWEGEYLIVYVGKDDAKVFDGKHDAAANYTVGTFYGEEGNESNLICVPNPDDYTMYFDPCDGGYNIMNSDANWWSYKDASNGFSVSSSTSFAGKYSISLDANGNAIIKNAGNYNIKFNTAASTSGGDRFRFYGTSIYTTVKLYEKYGSCHHNWVLDETASTAATCGKAGNNVYECSICHETKNETVPALQHDYYYNEVPATCTEEGYTECYCHNCDYAEILDYTITEPLGHDFSVIVEDEDHYIAPTCTESGLAIYQCSRCDAFDTETSVVEPLGHNYVNGVCSRCGDEMDAQTYTLMTSLDFTNAGSVIMVIKYEDEYYALSEEADGKYLVCKSVTVTNDTITVYDDGTYAIVMPIANCNDGAYTGYGFETAERNFLHINSKGVEFAQETANAAIAITPAMVWNGDWDSHDNPIMKAVPNAYFLQGMTTGKYVSNYIDTYEDTELSVIDDSWFAVPVYFFASSYTKPIEPEPSTHNLIHIDGYPATCTEDGYLDYYMCIDGDCECAGKMYADIYCTEEIYDLTIPALGHEWQWCGIVGEDGFHGVECSRCHETDLVACTMVNGTCSVCGYTTAGTEALNILSAALVLNGKIDVAYTVKVPTGYADPRMVFTGPNGDITVTDYTTDSDGNYVFTYTGINPQCMGDDITATLYASKAGTPESVSVEDYSVRNYCVNMLARNDISASLRTLLSDILAYGAAAQTYMNYKTDAPVNTGSDINAPDYSTFTAVSGNEVSFNGTADANCKWISAGLTLTNSVAMNFRFYAASTDNLSVTVSINGRSQTFTEFTSIGGDIYEVSFTGISAEEFADTVTASFARNDTQIGNTVSYSVNAYVQSKQTDSNADLAALVKALYNYGASAAAYKN